jgi:hypothetical protein
MSFPTPITSAALAQFLAVSSLLGESGDPAELDIPSVVRLYEATGALPRSSL